MQSWDRPQSDHQRIQFAANVEREMSIGVVFRYPIDTPRISNRESKPKGLNAMSAFCKPFAYQGLHRDVGGQAEGGSGPFNDCRGGK